MFKLRLIIRNTRVLMMTVSLGMMSGWANAAEILWTPEQDVAGFMVMEPSINIDALVDDVVTLKIALKQDEKRLSRQVEQKRITGNETWLSFLLPGGMLYAAYKKNAHTNAIREHKLVSSQLLDITVDLVALTTTAEPIVVAKR
ncbi:MAG: hypothetical protein KAT25_00575 [Sulfuriflexus sp.]|nr:hypothetical protein [Sulfuriflexus sp.]